MSSAAEQFPSLHEVSAACKLEYQSGKHLEYRKFRAAACEDSKYFRAVLPFVNSSPVALASPAGADAPSRILESVPAIISDSMDVWSWPTSHGCTCVQGLHRAPANAAAVEALLQAGAHIIGKGAVTGLSLGSTGANTPLGAVVNPYSVHGALAGPGAAGVAVAVACKVAAFGLAVDTVGDARVPAALVGAVAFRPSFGRYAARGIWHGAPTLDSVAIVTAHVKDLLLLDALLEGARNIECPQRELPALARKRKSGSDDDEDEEDGAESKHDEDEGEDVNDAAAKVQALFRARAARKRVDVMRGEMMAASATEEQKAAALSIQRIARGKAARSAAAARAAEAEAARATAAAKIQALMRGKAARAAAPGPAGAGALDLHDVVLALPWDDVWAQCDGTVQAVAGAAFGRWEGAGVRLVYQALPTVTLRKLGKHGKDVELPLLEAARMVAHIVRRAEQLPALGSYLVASGLDVQGASVAAMVDDACLDDATRQHLRELLTPAGQPAPAVVRAALAHGLAAVQDALTTYLGHTGASAVCLPATLAPACVPDAEDNLLLRGVPTPAAQVLHATSALAPTAGAPALSMPVGVVVPRAAVPAGQPGSERVPVSVELLAQPGNDAQLIKSSAALASCLPRMVDPLTLARWRRGVDHAPNQGLGSPK